MLAYGATFDLTPREKGMKGAIERAIDLVETTPGALDAATVRKSREHRRARAQTTAPGDSRRLSPTGSMR